MEAHSPYQLLADVSKISEPTAAGIFRMASKSWSLMYTIARVENALEHALSHLSGSASATYPAAFKAGIEALKSKDLTTVVAMSGTAMLPTLNGLVGEKEDIVDRLLMRCLPKISGKSVFAGDVVAFKPPPGVDGDLLIRRVAAVEGEEMISDDPEDEAFHLKPGELWVLADNQEMQPAQANDSRTFGPLNGDQILGRILYYVRSQTEHGPVQNSDLASTSDRAVLEAELDVDKLMHTES